MNKVTNTAFEDQMFYYGAVPFSAAEIFLSVSKHAQ